MSNRPKSPPYRMVPSKEEDDNDISHHIVLTPALDPYNKEDKIKEANMQLKKEGKYELGQRSSKVRFKEVVTYDDEDIYLDEDEEEEDVLRKRESSDAQCSGSKPCSKILLVTVPTGFCNESEEILTDEEDCENDIDVINNSFRLEPREFQKQKSVSSFNSETSEEELEENTPPLTEDTFSSSVETVICRSETEDSDLTEVFSKTVNINSRNEHTVHQRENTEDSLEYFDFVSLFREEGGINNGKPLAENCDDQYSSGAKKARPNTAFSVSILKKSTRQKCVSLASESNTCGGTDRNMVTERPSTAPARRGCCKSGISMKLPSYNGLRSEYGMSAEQLKEREKKKMEIASALRYEKERKYVEQRIKRKENETMFNNWLIKKKREAEARAMRRMRQSHYCFRTIPAPTTHLDKIGILRRKMLKRENTCFLLNEIFRNSKPHEKITYKIYLGLS